MNWNQDDSKQSTPSSEHSTQIPPVDDTQAPPPIREPQWFGVSYQGEAPCGSVPQSTKKSKKLPKILIIACLVAAVLFVTLAAAFGGALLARFLGTEDTPPQNDGGVTYVPSGSSGSSGSGTTVYENAGFDSYDYTSVELQKNDGSALTDSRNGSAGNSPMRLQEAVAAVQDSVVEITATATSVRGTISEGAGSGVIVHADGIIVTNNHVIRDTNGNIANNIYVIVTDHSKTDADGNFLQYTYKANVRGTYEEGDIAVLKISTAETGQQLTVAKLGSSKDVVLAEDVFAIGNPLGQLGGTVTNGIISAVSRQVLVDDVAMTLLQTNAAINSGNSGGGLFNLAGELIGIVNAKYSASGVEGLGFAIPIDLAVDAIEDLIEYQYKRGIPALGVTLTNGSYSISLWQREPVVVVYDAGTHPQLKTGDIIRQVGGANVSNVSTLKSLIRSHAIGEEVVLTVEREGESSYIQVTVKLVEYQP